VSDKESKPDSKGVDFYKLYARVLPVYIVLLPGGIAAKFWLANSSILGSVVALIGGPLCLAFLAAEMGRDAGHRKQRDLWERWGGSPSVQRLRHRNAEVNPVVRTRLHRKLLKLVPDVTLPTAAEESADPLAADHAYDACVQVLIARTRDTRRFRLLYKENVSYGFRRNLWGLKPVGLMLAVLGTVATSLFAWRALPNLAPDIPAALITHAGLILFWLVIVTREWVRVPADAYASRLFEACDELSA